MLQLSSLYNAMQEQSEGNTLLLTSLAQMKEETSAVENAALELKVNTENVIYSIMNIGKK